MNILKIPYYSALDHKLEELWENDDELPEEWSDFIKYLDKNIIDVESLSDSDVWSTAITFSKPEHITWFIMRWS